jgi:hypothetical protein
MAKKSKAVKKSKAEKLLNTINEEWTETYQSSIFDELKPEDVFRLLVIIRNWYESSSLPPEYRAWPLLSTLCSENEALTDKFTLKDMKDAFSLWAVRKVHES